MDVRGLRVRRWGVLSMRCFAKLSNATKRSGTSRTQQAFRRHLGSRADSIFAVSVYYQRLPAARFESPKVSAWLPLVTGTPNRRSHPAQRRAGVHVAIQRVNAHFHGHGFELLGTATKWASPGPWTRTAKRAASGPSLNTVLPPAMSTTAAVRDRAPPWSSRRARFRTA